MVYINFRKLFYAVGLAAVMIVAGLSDISGTIGLGVSTAQAQTAGKVPGGTLGGISDPELWRFARKGGCGTVSIPNKDAGCLVQSHGDTWRAFKNGTLSQIGGWSMLGIIIALGLFYAFRGRIQVDSGLSGQTIERFNALERFAHWLTASSFIVLALSGLNLFYGRYVIKPLLGADIFAWLAEMGKFAHNYIGFAFIIGILLMLVLWVRDNIPTLDDLKWLAIGGGLFSKGVHPPAKRFNAGQKLIFWSVVIGGGSLSLSGLMLMEVIDIKLWAGTFSILNAVGFDMPTTLTALQENQLSTLWHSVIALVMIVIIVGHIYIGSVGMEGAIDAVGTGQVDVNWAKEHHSIWVEEHFEEIQDQPAE
jgi:formate dehydrogenase subunit gamma